MTRNSYSIWYSCLVVLCHAGCAMDRQHVSLVLPPSAHLVEVGTNRDLPSRDRVLPVGTKLAPRNVLVLSGGGANGAYTAGVLNGWTASGTRPQFDVVTGVSTGALIAPFAFLGSDHDETLRQSYTSAKESDIFKRRWLPELLWADSLADSAPLKRKIASEITPNVLAKVAEAHRAGRRLYVGTTDIDSKRLVIWDMGAIACRDDANKLGLFRDVLLASASVPGLLPPVDVQIDVDGTRYTELHVDGGVAAALFLQPSMVGVTPDQDVPSSPDDSHVYVIVAGQLQLPRRTVKRRLTKVFEESISSVLQSQLEGDLLKIYLLSRFSGASFALTSVPKDITFESAPLAFDPVTMRKLFETGYQHAATREGWHFTPASLAQDELAPPRSGVEFTVQESVEAQSDVSARTNASVRTRPSGQHRSGSGSP